MKVFSPLFAHSQLTSKLESILKFNKLAKYIFLNLSTEDHINVIEAKEHLSPSSGHGRPYNLWTQQPENIINIYL